MNTIAFIWDNFGPMHVDRCDAVQKYLSPKHTVVGLELYGSSAEYDWVPETGKTFVKHTLMPAEGRGRSFLRRTLVVLRAIRATRARYIFFCNYERAEILVAAIISRLSGRRCYVMGCSKFDDVPRSLWREVLKSLFYLPYQGGIASGVRSRDYMRFLGLRDSQVVSEYNTLSIDRIREAAGVPPAPDGASFESRHLTIVARLVPKKNLSAALDAYSIYAADVPDPRPLHLCGSGPLEQDLREQAAILGIGDRVVFRGFLQSDAIARVLGQSLALLLPSVEEQFGNVVIEAQAMGLPVIISDNCGARDKLVRSGKNGFIVEPDNIEGMAYFMGLLSLNEANWARFASASAASAPQGDAARFAEAVADLVNQNSPTR